MPATTAPLTVTWPVFPWNRGTSMLLLGLRVLADDDVHVALDRGRGRDVDAGGDVRAQRVRHAAGDRPEVGHARLQAERVRAGGAIGFDRRRLVRVEQKVVQLQAQD